MGKYWVIMNGKSYIYVLGDFQGKREWGFCTHLGATLYPREEIAQNDRDRLAEENKEIDFVVKCVEWRFVDG